MTVVIPSVLIHVLNMFCAPNNINNKLVVFLPKYFCKRNTYTKYSPVDTTYPQTVKLLLEFDIMLITITK